MKKKVLLIIGVAVFAVAVAFNISISSRGDSMSDIALANVDALAEGESGLGKGLLYGNAGGTLFCCCPGNNDCGAADCSGC